LIAAKASIAADSEYRVFRGIAGVDVHRIWARWVALGIQADTPDLAAAAVHRAFSGRPMSPFGLDVSAAEGAGARNAA